MCFVVTWHYPVALHADAREGAFYSFSDIVISIWHSHAPHFSPQCARFRANNCTFSFCEANEHNRSTSSSLSHTASH